jgi:calcineurin-like phosphoesterase family protein
MGTLKKTFFSSDFHLSHKNILEYDKRPFKNVHEMNEAIIRNHNAVVSPEDDFYFLGDFCFNMKEAEGFLQRLNGNKFFIKGNHDKYEMIKLYKQYGTYLGGMSEITVNGQQITLCHYAMRIWNKSHHGTWQLYGHSHGTLPDDTHALSIDVGTNVHGYKPLEFADVQRIMAKKDYKPVDHHRAARV